MFGSRGHVGDILEATYDDYDDDDEDDEPCFCECEDESNVGCCIVSHDSLIMASVDND